MADFDELSKSIRFVDYLAAAAVTHSAPELVKTLPKTSASTIMLTDPTNAISAFVTNSTASPVPPSQPAYFFWIGLGLAMGSSLFIGCSFVIKKRALLNLAHRDMSHRAGQGGHGYLKDWMWWAGTIMMGIGEGCNFAAYAFAPAVLVTPLGALSVLVTAVLSSLFLKENLNLLGKLGCAVCLIGSVIIIIHAPQGGDVATMAQLAVQLAQPGFILYAAFVLLLSCSIIFYVAPKFGDRLVIIYVLLCSMIGSFVVVCTKGIGLAITESFAGISQVSNFLTWICLLGMVLFVIINLNYLNKALDLFNTALVTPIYYVFFTLFVMIVSAILYQEFDSLGFADGLGLVMGFLVTIIGIFIMQIFREVKLDWNQLWYMLSGSKDSSLYHFQIMQYVPEYQERPPKEDFDEFVDTTPILTDEIRGALGEYIPIHGNSSVRWSASASCPPSNSRSSQSLLINETDKAHYGSII